MAQVTLKVDHRESELKNMFQSSKCDFLVLYENLLHGDFVIEIDGKVLILIERKTLADLAASIKDGRYHKQKVGLLASYPHTSTYYLIEGMFDYDEDASVLINGLSKKALISAMINTLVRDKLRVVTTRDTRDTFNYLKCIMSRVSEDPAKYANGVSAVESQPKPCKTSSINKTNCFEIQLCQIPDVSTKTAKAISTQFNNSMKEFYDVLGNLEDSEKLKLLKDICIVDATGKKRRISEKVIKSIVQLMF